MRQLPKARALAIALATLLVAGSCATAAPPTPTAKASTAFVIPAELPNGRVEITIVASYPIGTPLAIPITVVVTRGTITGPVTARIMASGINEGGLPAEVLVRELIATPVTVTTGRRSMVVAWDTKDLKGVLVPADAYSLVLEFRSEDGGTRTVTRAGATVELRTP